MANGNTFIFFPEWLEDLKSLSDDRAIFNEAIAEIVLYGAGAEWQNMLTDNKLIQAITNHAKRDLEFSKSKYQNKIESGKNGGRPKKVNDKEIYELAKKGMKSAEIAAELGISKSSIDHSDGWRARNSDEFIF